MNDNVSLQIIQFFEDIDLSEAETVENYGEDEDYPEQMFNINHHIYGNNYYHNGDDDNRDDDYGYDENCYEDNGYDDYGYDD